MNTIDATFTIARWDEKAYDEPGEGPRLTRAAVGKTYRGGVSGEGEVEYLMMHRPDETASFVGLERVRGKVGERAGTFVIEHRGTYVEGKVDSTMEVVPGSGTGDLAGIRGKAVFVAGHEESYPVRFEIEFGGE